MSTENNSQDRADSFVEMLVAYGYVPEDADLLEAAVDLMTDFRHFMDVHEINTECVERVSLGHFEEEKNQEEGQES